MSAHVVAFAGISGVGKTTFLRSLGRHVSFQHLTGGSLISAARRTADNERDTLRHANLDENQRLLIQGFALKRDEFAQLIIMDGHVVIDADDKFQKVAISVFEDLGIRMMVHLESDPALIVINRSQDLARSRPVHSVEVLSQHQQISRQYAEEVAARLDIEFVEVDHEGVQTFGELLVQRLSDWKR